MTAPSSPVALLDQLDELRANATAGPWELEHDTYGDEWWFGGETHGGQEVINDAIVTDASHAADAALIVAAVNAVGPLTAAVRAAEDALTLVRRDGCENTTGRWTCLEPNSGRTRDARYGADRWCDSCVAADALNALTAALSVTP